MKKNYLLLGAFIALIIACNKEVMTKNDIVVESFVNAKKLSGKERTNMTNSISADPMFRDYLLTLVEIQKIHDDQFSKIKNYDAEKMKSAEKPKNEKEFIAQSKSAGFENPELILAKYKEATGKLAALYRKYPNFSNSLNEEEKKAFFKQETLKLYSK
ncbi:hypothetical protein D9M68_594670 [compost metagenome]